MIEDALRSGALSQSGARELARVATTSTETSWLDNARGKTLREIEEMVSGRKPGDLPTDPPDPDVQHAPITFEECSPATQALVRQARMSLNAELGESLDDDQLLAALCRRAIERAAAPHAANADATATTPVQMLRVRVLARVDALHELGVVLAPAGGTGDARDAGDAHVTPAARANARRGARR